MTLKLFHNVSLSPFGSSGQESYVMFIFLRTKTPQSLRQFVFILAGSIGAPSLSMAITGRMAVCSLFVFLWLSFIFFLCWTMWEWPYPLMAL